jgi:serine/threonine protein kinase
MKKIGKYEILGLLGRGGMSRVYKVRMPVTGKILALKLMSLRFWEPQRSGSGLYGKPKPWLV